MEIIIWLAFCGAVAYYAEQKKRNPVGWFFLAFFISPLLAGVFLAMSKDLKVEEEIKKIEKDNENIKMEMKFNEKFNDYRAKEISNRVNLLEQTTNNLLIQSKFDNENKNNFLLKETKNSLLLNSSQNNNKCSKCNAILDKNSLFCTQCGEKVSKKIPCNYCNNEIDPNSKFCQFCGNSIKSFKICSKCNLELENNVKFCSNCGLSV